jgi:hypothetical protein
MTTSLKTPELAFHPLFQEFNAETDELLLKVGLFLSGDPGVFSDDEEVLGFMDKDLKGKLHHGVYETATTGRIHIIGDREKIIIMPDIAFAEFDRTVEGSINLCTCNDKEPKKKRNPNN